MEDKPEKMSVPAPGRSVRKTLRQDILRAVVVDNVQRFVGWAIAAILPLPFAVVKIAAHDHSAAVVAAGISLICLVPPGVGVARSRLWRRTRKAETERDTLRVKNVELVAATNQATRSSKMLADWLNDTLVDPYRRRNVDPNRDFETWLNDIVIKVMRVVFLSRARSASPSFPSTPRPTR
jgi:hypothetical protein